MLKVFRALRTRPSALKSTTMMPSLRVALMSTKFGAKKPTAITVKPLTSTLATRKMSGTIESDSRGEGTVAGAIPTIYEQGVGIEHEELSMAIETGNVRFDRAPLMGPFGTVAAPVPVPSGLDSRIVACMGGGPGPDQEEHGMVWFNVKKGSLTACVHCGQVFTLVPPTPRKISEQNDYKKHDH